MGGHVRPGESGSVVRLCVLQLGSWQCRHALWCILPLLARPSGSCSVTLLICFVHVMITPEHTHTHDHSPSRLTAGLKAVGQEIASPADLLVCVCGP